MRLSELKCALGLEVLSEGDLSREVQGCYCSDLLSHCMSNIDSGNLWITVQVNINIVAIAVLTELSAIIISQDMTVDSSVIEKATEENITIFRSPLPSYELCLKVGSLI
jgi:hypothetical protein